MIELPGQINHSMYLASPYTHAEPRVVNQRHRDVCMVAENEFAMQLGKPIICVDAEPWLEKK